MMMTFLFEETTVSISDWVVGEVENMVARQDEVTRQRLCKHDYPKMTFVFAIGVMKSKLTTFLITIIPRDSNDSPRELFTKPQYPTTVITSNTTNPVLYVAAADK